MLRYSLSNLLLFLLYVSVACVALVNASGIWPQVATTITVCILLFFTLAVACWKERARYFAMGFSIAGWVYFALIFSSVLSVRGYLLTDTAVNWLYSTIHEKQGATSYVVETQVRLTSNGPVPTQTLVPVYRPTPTPIPPTAMVGPGVAPAAYTAPPPVLRPSLASSMAFASIAHSLWAVIVACLGGVVAQVLYVRRQRAEMDAFSEERSESHDPKARP